MADRQYYYIRLKEGFFDAPEMQVLEAMKDGYLYSNILLKLYLKSLKNEGKLLLSDAIPYNPEMIATITKHQIGTVERALEVFRQLGLIEVLSDGTIYMLNIQELIGKSSTEADRKRVYRKGIENEKKKLGNEPLGQMSDKCLGELEIELELEKELEIELKQEGECREGDALPQQKPSKSTRFIPPTTDEIKAYCSETGRNVDAERFVDFYSSKGWMVGKNKMKDWKAAVRNWERMEKEKSSGITEADRAKARLWGKGLDHQEGYSFEAEYYGDL